MPNEGKSADESDALQTLRECAGRKTTRQRLECGRLQRRFPLVSGGSGPQSAHSKSVRSQSRLTSAATMMMTTFALALLCAALSASAQSTVEQWGLFEVVLKGQSPARLAFLKKVLDDAPTEGIEPIDKWQNPEYGGKPSEYYLVYLGKQTPTSWEFKLPKPPQSKGQPTADGMKFTAEVLDTWNMTVTPVAGTLTLVKKTDYFHADKDGRSIVLPGKPYLAIQIKRVK